MKTVYRVKAHICLIQALTVVREGKAFIWVKRADREERLFKAEEKLFDSFQDAKDWLLRYLEETASQAERKAQRCRKEIIEVLTTNSAKDYDDDPAAIVSIRPKFRKIEDAYTVLRPIS